MSAAGCSFCPPPSPCAGVQRTWVPCTLQAGGDVGTRKGNSGGALAMQVVGWVHVWLAGFAGHVGFEVMQPGVGNRQPWCPGPGHVYLPEGFAGCEIKSASQLWWQLSRSAAHPCTLLRHSSIHGIPRALQELGRKGAVGSRGVSSPWVEWALFALIPLQWGSSFIQHLGCPPPLEGPCFGGGGARDPHVVHRTPWDFCHLQILGGGSKPSQ